MSDFIKAGVIGHPIGHSKSPLIHNYWIRKYGLEGSYEALDIEPQHLEQGLQRLIDQGYSGFNLTVPHKEFVIPFCDGLEETAHIIGAVNTLYFDQGQMIGANTDAFGFIQNIKMQQREYNFSGKRAVVIGAGGAARAVIYGLLKEDVAEVIICNRTLEKAQKLADDFKDLGIVKTAAWDERSEILTGVDIVVNSSSLGMSGQPALDINLQALSPEALVCDIVYAPLYTDLLKQAQDKGCLIVTGIGMLLHQARPAFEYWFGVLPDVDQSIENLVLE
ncbi:MAG: shikimate dehydrogenase [Micavibrio sp.]|nr:shikimate dehydrogenase [Micavibrio sp.]|tara:strand:+ start:1545 stop:2375 length:831 start_codon:yes stop_codon:yes gene_type:complete